MNPTQSQREDVHFATSQFRCDDTITITLPCRRLSATAQLPRYAHTSDAGADLVADEDVDVYSSMVQRVRTGVAICIPPGYVGFVKPRSGLAVKQNIDIFGGVIDAGYTGPLDVLLANFGSSTFCVKRGDRIAQFVVLPVVQGLFHEVDELASSQRGGAGFGSSGK